MNPWLNIWIRPRRTIREIIETDASLHILPLAAFAGTLSMLENFANRSSGDSLGIILIVIMSLIVGPFAGLVGIHFSGWLLRWSGSLLGGTARTEDVRAAIAWSYVPRIICLTVIFIPQILLIGQETFTDQTPILDARIESSPVFALLAGIIFIGVVIVAIISGIWYMAIYLQCLSEVHQFSIWKALFATLIPCMIVIIPVIITLLVV